MALKPGIPETKQDHWMRRRRELDGKRKADLCALYRDMGGLGGVHPPEKWRKDEVVSSIVEMEWSRLPEGQKLPDPPQLTPPCDTCGQGENATPHHHGGSHHYVYTHNPDAQWVPESEKEAERIEQLEAAPVTHAEILANPPFPPAPESSFMRHRKAYPWSPCDDCTTPITCEETQDLDRCP